MSGAETEPALSARALAPSNQSQPAQGGATAKPATPRSAGDSDGEAGLPALLERQSTGGDLSELQRVRVEIFDTNKDLQDLCRDNGLSGSQFAKRAHTVAVLDTFLGFWPSMKSVMHFPALRELSIVKHPTIVQIEGLESCPSLEQLTISECGLTRIENLDACRRLRKLNLSSNKIKSMEPVSRLEALEELWLSDNRIEKLEGLWRAKKLTTLWICRNRIERIDSALNGCESLAELNLADNRIFSFKTLLSLANLDNLAVLTLSDPHYGDNPVCRLCNYQTYLMCQLTRLTWLDTFELSLRNKQIAEATMLKKKMYYNMRIKCMKRDMQHRIRRVDDVRRNTEQHGELNISALMRHKKELEQALSDQECGELSQSSSFDAQTIKQKLQAIDDCLRERCAAIARMNHEFDAIRSRLQWTADVNISRLMLELETGGNIRLEDGSPSDAWYASCIDLVKSRLFIADLRPFGISDVKITRVTRINNRYLRNRFHARMEEILVVNEDQVKDNVSKKGVTVTTKDDDDDPGASDGAIEKVAPPGSVPEHSLEYLFYVQPPLMDCMRKLEPDQFYAAEYGFRDPSEYRAMGLEGAVKLSNSVSLIETSRLLAAFASKGVSLQKRELSEQGIAKYSTLTVRDQERELRNEFTREMREAAKLASQGAWEIPGGVLLVVKVFPGYTNVIPDTEVLPSPIDQRDHIGLHSLQVMKSSQTHINVTNEGSQKMYYMFDKTLILPEYLVEFQYVSTSQQPKDVNAVLTQELEAASSSLKSTEEEHSGLGAAATLADDFERRYRIRRPASPQVDEEGYTIGISPNANILDDAVLKLLEAGPLGRVANSSDSMLPMTRINLVQTGKLKYLHLLGCGIEAMPDLCVLKDCLEVLVLAYNRIPNLDSSLRVLHKLKHLDVSSNRITRVDHIDTLNGLAQLDVSNNQVQSFDDLTGFSHEWRVLLRLLNLRKNPVCSTKRYRLRMIRTVGSSLELLDGQEVTRDEYLASQRLLTKLTPEILWARYQGTKAVCVSSPQASHVGNKIDTGDIPQGERQCWSAVEELILTRELITKIEGFDAFVNLRLLSFSDNAVRSIGGLEKCTRLEELNLEDNEITKVENLTSLAFLKRLNVARNRLTSIDQLESLENLTQLSLEDNHITSLRGLASAMKLMELYVGNNRIENLKEVQHLKALPKLTILDLSGNEITRLTDYRLYTVYYLRRVKVLDGVSVSAQDQSEAKQKYSGKLSVEFIAEKCGSSNFDRLQELDLSSCRIRELGSINGKIFPNLRDLNFENNQINDISGLEYLPKLRILNLNRNRIEKLLLSANATGGSIPDGAEGKGILSCTKLEQLFLAYNQINDMTALGLQHLESLRVLHLQGNAIVFFAGLDSNTELLELRLDKNKIRQLDPHSTTSLRRLRVLSLDDNGLRTLSNFNDLMSIEFLDLSNNRVSEIEEIDNLNSMRTIVELRLLNNPMVKKHMYRHTTLFKLNTLRNLDGREVTAEERDRVEVLFLHERAAAMMSQSAERPPNVSTTQFSLAPSTVPGKHGGQTSTAGSQMMIMAANRNMASQLSAGDVLAGSLLRKNPISPAGFSPNQQPVQSVSTFPKSDQPPDSTIAIAPGNTTTKSLLNSSNNSGNVYRGYSVSNQAGANSSLPTSFALSSPSGTVTVGSALNASLSNTGGDQLNLGALRFDRRRMNSVHYDPALNGNYAQAGPVGMATGASGLAGGVITTSSLLRGPINVPSPQSAIIHPLSADLNFSSKIASSTYTNGTAAEPSTRSFSGYVISVGNQKRFGSLQERTNAADLAASLASAAKSGTRPR